MLQHPEALVLHNSNLLLNALAELQRLGDTLKRRMRPPRARHGDCSVIAKSAKYPLINLQPLYLGQQNLQGFAAHKAYLPNNPSVS